MPSCLSSSRLGGASLWSARCFRPSAIDLTRCLSSSLKFQSQGVTDFDTPYKKAYPYSTLQKYQKVVAQWPVLEIADQTCGGNITVTRPDQVKIRAQLSSENRGHANNGGGLSETKSLEEISADIRKSDETIRFLNRRFKSIVRVMKRHGDQVPRRPVKITEDLIPIFSEYEVHRLGQRSLARWIDCPPGPERSLLWQQMLPLAAPHSLPFILLHHLNSANGLEGLENTSENSFQNAALKFLKSKGLTMTDVQDWASILMCQTNDLKAQRFTSTSSSRPLFLLLEILRGSLLEVRSFKALLIFTRDLFLRKLETGVDDMSDNELSGITASCERSKTGTDPLAHTFEPSTARGEAFYTLFKHLINHARLLWPSAMVTVANMVSSYAYSTLNTSGDSTRLDKQTYTRLCTLFNDMLNQLAEPASIEPFKSMIHNWGAQRVLLNAANNFEPPLLLSKRSYQALVRVLTASKKSTKESRIALLRKRSWPPWRTEQDGIDAQQAPEDDLSRAVAVLSRAQESGYRITVQDMAMQILGGRELDGTPTIHTRTLQKFKNRDHFPSTGLETEIWSARIEATRDVEEAWSAFLSFKEAGGEPDALVYSAMLEKLIYETIRSNRGSRHNGVPGDGKELIAPEHDNYSEFYKLKREPPPFDMLYMEMVRGGVRPSGRILNLLIRSATTIDDGLQYMLDAGISRKVVSYLKGPDDGIPSDVLEFLYDRTFAAYIFLLCRFAPRFGSSNWNEESTINDGNASRDSTLEGPGGNFDAGGGVQRGLKVIELSRNTSIGQRFPNPLHLATKLLTKRKCLFRPAWYAVFQAVARRDAIIDRGELNIGNDLLSWQVLLALVKDFHACGMELDPRGFQLICHGAEKAIRACLDTSVAPATHAKNALELLKEEFKKLTESTSNEYMMPRLMHSIGGHHIHPYVRVLGYASDYEEIICVLKWMVENQEALSFTADQAANGYVSLRKVIVAIKTFCRPPKYAAEAKRLVESLEVWGNWPEDEEVEEYMRY